MYADISAPTQMLTEYNSNLNVTIMLDHYDWYMMPVFNADGYEYTHTTVSEQLKKTVERDKFMCLVILSATEFSHRTDFGERPSHRTKAAHASVSTRTVTLDFTGEVSELANASVLETDMTFKLTL